MLMVENATVRFGAVAALDDVDLTVDRGEIVALLGPSGSGKSTLLRAVAGLQTLDSGVISWDGQSLDGVAPDQRDFGLMFQDFALFPHLDVSSNVAFGLRMHDWDRIRIRERVEEMLELVDLASYGDRGVASLSGGEAQRVALARALASRPRMLLLDEPLGSLDRSLRERLVVDLATIFEAAGITALYVTHDHDEAFAIADRIAIIDEGRLLRVDAAPAVWANPRTETVARFLGFDTIVDAVVADGVATTSLGSVRVAGITDGPTKLLIRPSAVRIDSSGPLHGTVLTSTFRGDHYAVVVDTSDVRLEARHDTALHSGTAVSLSVDPQGIVSVA